MFQDHPPQTPLFQGLRASRYFAGWSERGRSDFRRRCSPWARQGLDLFRSDPSPDRPDWSPPVAHLPDHDPRWYASIPYAFGQGTILEVDGYLGDAKRAPHFGRDRHDAETWVDGRTAPLVRFSLESAADRRWQPGFRYRIGDPSGRWLAWVDSERSLDIENGRSVWRCTTADGQVVEARHRPAAPLPAIPKAALVRELLLLAPRVYAGVLRSAVAGSEQSKIDRLDLHDRWVDGAVLGPEGGWELVDERERPLLWMLPPGVGHLSAWALVGPHRASLAGLDPAVVLFAFFVLYAHERPRLDDGRDWVT